MNTFSKFVLLLTLLGIAILIPPVVPISILLLGDSLTIGYTLPKHSYHPYEIQLAEDYVQSSIEADVKKNIYTFFLTCR